MERFTVSLDDFIKYLIKKWKIIAGCVLISIILFALSAIMLGEKIVIPPSEEYFQLKEQEESFEKYIENSPIMKIDATNVQERTVYISNIIARDSLKNYIESGAVWERLDDEVFRQYFSDLVTWYDSSNQSAEIVIQHYDENQCGKIAGYLAEEIVKYDEQLDVLQGDSRAVSDESISDVQTWYFNRLNAIQGQLEYAAAGYTIEASLPVAIILGIFSGALIAIIYLFLFFLIKEQ